MVGGEVGILVCAERGELAYQGKIQIQSCARIPHEGADGWDLSRSQLNLTLSLGYSHNCQLFPIGELGGKVAVLAKP